MEKALYLPPNDESLRMEEITRIIESPQPSWGSSHGIVRGYGNRQTYLPVQDLVLVSLFVGWVTSSK